MRGLASFIAVHSDVLALAGEALKFRATVCQLNPRDNHALAAGSEDCLALPHPVVWGLKLLKNNKSGEKTPCHA
jgi:hypothetical protein